MLRIEIAELMKDSSRMYEIAEKVNYNQVLTSEEKEVYEISDAWAKQIGATGSDEGHEISEYIRKTIQDEVYDTPDELLDLLFKRGSIGEFDDVYYDKLAKNTLVAYEASKGGVVDKSYIDVSTLKPAYTNRQVDTQLSYRDLRKNGFKSIAQTTTFAKESLHNALFNDIFTKIDTALIVGGGQAISCSGAVPTKTEMDALSLYCIDRDPTNSVAVGLSKYMQAVGNMTGYTSFMTEQMKSDFNRYGLAKFYGGISLASISGAKKQGNGGLLIPDKRIFGCAGQIGSLDMRGEIHVFQDMDNQNETVNIYVKDFEYGFAITNIDNIYKIVLN